MRKRRKLKRDRQLNQQKKSETESRAIAAQIKQLVEVNRVDEGDADVIYNFTDASVVKRLHVSQQVHEHLVSGRLAIARLGEAYALVPVPVAEKIRQRDEHCVILYGQADETQYDGDDPYADDQIPDDLMW